MKRTFNTAFGSAAMMFRGRRLLKPRSNSSKKLTKFRASKTKRRVDRSYTRTKRRRQKNSVNDQLATGADKTFTRLRHKKNRYANIVKNISAPQYSENIYAIRLESVVGAQNQISAAQWVVPEINRMFSNLTAPTTSAGGSSQLVINKATTEYAITNSSTSVTSVWIYDCVARQDISTNQTKIYDPIFAWRFGYQTEDTTTSQALQPFCTPFTSRLFCTNYKVVNVKRINMAPGVLHTHIVTQTDMNFFKEDRLRDSDTSGGASGGVIPTAKLALKGHTVYTMFVIMGQPGHNALVPGNVSVAPAAIDIIQRTRYVYRVAESRATRATWQNSVPLVTDVTTVPEATGGFVNTDII